MRPDRWPRTLTRRMFLRASLGAAGVLAFACAPSAAPSPAKAPADAKPAQPQPTAAPAAATTPAETKPAAQAAPAKTGFDWKRFQGKTVRFMVNSHDWTNNTIRPNLREFEELTGIRPTWEIFPEDQFRQKLTVELTAQGGSVDGFMSLTSWDGLRFIKAGWYEPIQPYLDDASLTGPDFDFEDYFENTVKIGTVGSTLIGVPLYPEVQPLYYRKDLLEARNIKVPETLDEFEAAAKQLTNRGDNMFGYVSRGKRSAAVYTLAPFIFAEGGNWLDGQGKPTFNSPESVRGLDRYARMLRESGPPGVENVHVYEVQDLFAQGRVALATESSNIVSTLEDPTKSQTVGQVGYAMFPSGPGGSHTPLISWSLSISPQSKNKEAAWYFIQWACSKEMCLRQVEQKIPTARQSAWNSAQFQDQMPKGWVEVFEKSVPQAYVNQANPLVVAVPETRDVIGEALVKVIGGADAKGAADEAQVKLADIIQKTQG
jgi:multiple sugar transport system substrate-binding protein